MVTNHGTEPIGPLIARVRADRGLSQDLLAERLCATAALPTLTRHEISRWERGERIPGHHWRGWLSRVLDVPLARLERAAAVARDARHWSVRLPAGWRQEQPGVYARIGGPIPSMSEPR